MSNPKEEFIADLYPAARRIGRETGMSWELILAQAALETGWGEKTLPGTNNIFNIKADSSWHGESKSFNVPEFVNGKWVQQNASFRVYDSIDDALRDRVQFLRENPRYAQAGLFDESVKGDLRREAAALQKAGYATDPKYADTLAEVFGGRTMRHGIEQGSQRVDATREPARVQPHASQVQHAHTQPAASTRATEGHWPAPGNSTINHADKPGEGRGEFGTPRGGHRHGGIDIQGQVGDPIEPYAAGRVTRVVPNNGAAGNMIEIDHGHGITTRYMHLEKMNVKAGDQVTPETVIGTMGRSGNTPRQGDTHLHFELLQNGNRVNPLDHLHAPGTERQRPDATPAHRASAPTHAGARADGLIEYGEKGSDVEALQRSLARLGYTGKDGKPLTPDSDFGSNTRAAVEAFQKAHGLHVDGKAGKDTLPALAKAAEHPLVSEATHPNHGLYAAIGKQLPAGTKPEAIASVTLQSMENGITSPAALKNVTVQGHDAFVTGTTPGYRVKVDLEAPTPAMPAMSDHMARQTQEQQHRAAHPAPSQGSVMVA